MFFKTNNGKNVQMQGRYDVNVNHDLFVSFFSFFFDSLMGLSFLYSTDDC